LRLNAEKSGTFACSGGLSFVTSVENQTSSAIRVDTISLTFTSVAGSACSNHAAPIDPQIGMTAPAGVATEIRRVDLAGDLCSAPYGAAGCQWLGKATVATSLGTLTNEIAFTTGPAPTANRAPRISSLESVSAGSYSYFVRFTVSDPDGDAFAWTATLSRPPGTSWSIGTLLPGEDQGCPYGTGTSSPGPGRHQVSGRARRRTELCVYYRSPLNAGAVNVLTVTADDGQLDAESQAIRLIAYRSGRRPAQSRGRPWIAAAPAAPTSSRSRTPGPGPSSRHSRSSGQGRPGSDSCRR
jgi:hypothetical protein